MIWDLIIDEWEFPIANLTSQFKIPTLTSKENAIAPALQSKFQYGKYSPEIYERLYGDDWMYRLWYRTAYGEDSEINTGGFKEREINTGGFEEPGILTSPYAEPEVSHPYTPPLKGFGGAGWYEMYGP